MKSGFFDPYESLNLFRHSFEQKESLSPCIFFSIASDTGKYVAQLAHLTIFPLSTILSRPSTAWLKCFSNFFRREYSQLLKRIYIRKMMRRTIRNLCILIFARTRPLRLSNGWHFHIADQSSLFYRGRFLPFSNPLGRRNW